MLRVCVSRQGRSPKVQICPFNELARRRSRQQSCSCGLPRAVAIVVARPALSSLSRAPPLRSAAKRVQTLRGDPNNPLNLSKLRTKLEF